ncbi:hypothetical protein [Roseibium sp. RKSG952]|uniref:hypothetical protein n=1 Tax=Roseibium sp. RKSG952 TaxID=2529384 RepID=UPI0012BCDCBD|nr:hypothetical protein [Roseibium sp. RKSG952]MTH99050.1 hypothetical protein [Roseibium sp. RKSG952]
MSTVQSVDPQKNLASIIHESGLSQAAISKTIESRGYSVARATIHRWAKPQKQTRNFTYNPVIMLCLLDVCSQDLIVPLKLADLFSDEEALLAKLRARKSRFNLVPGILKKAAEDLTASKYEQMLIGRFSADLSCEHGSGEYFNAELDISKRNDYTFDVTCQISRNAPFASAVDLQEYTGAGTMLVWDDKAVVNVEVEMEALTLLTMHLNLPRRNRVTDCLDGAIIMSEGESASPPWTGRITLYRSVSSTTRNAEEQEVSGELPMPSDFQEPIPTASIRSLANVKSG